MRRIFGVAALIGLLSVAIPVNALAQALASDSHDPLKVLNLQTAAQRVCFDFMNLTAKRVIAVKFSISVLDQYKTVQYNTHVSRHSNNWYSPGQTVTQTCADVQSLDSFSTVQVSAAGLTYDDGTTWVPGQQFARAYNYDGSAYAYLPPRFHWSWSTDPTNTAPIYLNDASLDSHGDSRADAYMENCVGFRNMTNSPMTSITLAYSFRDIDNTPLSSPEFQQTFTGQFSPPNAKWNGLIDDRCFKAALPSDATVARMRKEYIRVMSVAYADGSQWSRGQAWNKSFLSNGQAYSGATCCSGVVAQSGAPRNDPPPAAGGNVVRLACTRSSSPPVTIVVDKTNPAVWTATLLGADGTTSRAMTTAYHTQTQISWAWPITDQSGNIVQDSWTLNRATLAASEYDGPNGFQWACAPAQQNQI